MIQSIETSMSLEIVKLLTEIDEFKGSWRAYQNLAPERLQALRQVATVESVASSTRIEGVKLTDREVARLLQDLKQREFTTRDEQEVAGYAEVMELVFESHSNIPLSENHVKQLHSLLLQFSTKDERHRGTYKTLSNSVAAFDATGKETGVIFETATPFETPLQMAELIRWTNQALSETLLHPLIVVAVFTVKFLAIHPFQDGNGRLSRILTTLLLLKAGYTYVPYSSMESVIEGNKQQYYLALRRTQVSLQRDEDAPDWLPWFTFFLRSMRRQKDNLLRKVERERQFLQAMPKLDAEILQLVRENGRTTTPEVVIATQATRANVRKRLAALVSSNLLQKHGRSTGTWYTLPL